MRKGDIILKMLETIEHFTFGMAELFGAFLDAGYGASYNKIQHQTSKRRNNNDWLNREIELKRKAKQRHYNLIYSLKKDNLIEEKINGDKKFFTITKKGRDKLLLLINKNKKMLPAASYQKEKSDKFIIITFDIPETEKTKREWLRVVIKNLGFKMIQKSVWIGQIKIPKEFLDDLLKLRLVDFIEIFEISKTGSLKQVIKKLYK
ncbi:MAG TPA: CRISPR-associated endonuclease Cas2 [Candidatus Wolfebacteria bacterium]|nr:CRISPR-associated endonuclease Cas2 [Candidatus Wolfebacteria bacterium]